jgi:hypothetical protein
MKDKLLLTAGLVLDVVIAVVALFEWQRRKYEHQLTLQLIQHSHQQRMTTQAQGQQ